MPTVYNVWLVNFELEQMTGYLKVLKTSLEDYQEKLETFDPYLGQEDLLDEYEKEKLFEAYIDEFGSVMGDFPRRLYSSFVVSWYSFVEDALLKLCSDLNLQIETELNPKKRPSSGIRRARELLMKNASYQFDPEQWRELTSIIDIRNKIVHNGGRFSYTLEKSPEFPKAIIVKQDDVDCYVDIDRNLYRYLKKHELLAFYGTFFIKPSPEYCEYLVSFGAILFDGVFTGLNLIED